ncbi:hypothetical protein HK405_009508, partial [Cladochytrium tenue]
MRAKERGGAWLLPRRRRCSSSPCLLAAVALAVVAVAAAVAATIFFLLAATSASSGRESLLQLRVVGLRSGRPHVPPIGDIRTGGGHSYQDDRFDAGPYGSRARFKWSPKPGGTAVRVAYVNRHSGTRANMNWLLEHIAHHGSVEVRHVHPDDDLGFGGYGMSKGDAERHMRSDAFANLCSMSDIIVVADTIPDARPFLTNILANGDKDANKSSPCFNTPVVLEITNRFDFAIEKVGPDRDDYLEAFGTLYQRNDRRFFVVVNNPFEPYYAHQMGVRFRRWRLARPVGFSDVEPQNDTDATAAVYRIPSSQLSRIFEVYGIPIKSVEYHYGGPYTLARYKAYVESPYQVATMKLFENLSAGVVMM